MNTTLLWVTMGELLGMSYEPTGYAYENAPIAIVDGPPGLGEN